MAERDEDTMLLQDHTCPSKFSYAALGSMLLPAQDSRLITGDTFSTQILLGFGDKTTLCIDKFHLFIARFTVCTKPPNHPTPHLRPAQKQSCSNPHEPLATTAAKISVNQSSPYGLRRQLELNFTETDDSMRI